MKGPYNFSSSIQDKSLHSNAIGSLEHYNQTEQSPRHLHSEMWTFTVALLPQTNIPVLNSAHQV